MTKIAGALTAVLLFVTAARAVEPADIAALLEAGNRSLSDVRTEFVQRSRVSGLPTEQKGSGEMVLKKDKGVTKFRFDYRKPAPQQIISDGKKVWIHQPEAKQAVVTSLEGAMGQANPATAYITGLGRLAKDFELSFRQKETDASGNYLLVLTPRQKGSYVASVTLTVSRESVRKFQESGEADPFPLLGSVVVDAGGNTTTMSFSGVRVNRGVKSSLFTFTPPAGTNVVTPPGR